MHYYQAPDHSLHALDDPQFTYLLPVGSVEINQVQYQAALPPAPAAQPLRCNARQIRGALTQAGLRSQVEAAVTASTDQNLKDAWNYGQIFVEDDPLVLAMSVALGQSAAQIHALFQLAGTLAP